MANEVVVDASVTVKALSERGDDAAALAFRLSNSGLHAPHLLDAEVGDVLRRKVLRGELAADTALAGLLSLDGLVEERYPLAGPLSSDAWALRDRIRFYDALYVALAARLRLPLLTADARLGRAHDLPCTVEVA